MAAFVSDALLIDFVPKDLIDPGRIGHDDWQEDDCRDKHDEQCLMARRRVPDRQAGTGIDRRRQNEGEHGDADRRDDAED